MDISKMSPRTGRILQEDGNVINEVDGKLTVHHDSVEVSGNGNIANINGYRKVTVASHGEGTAWMNVQVSIDGDNWYQKCCFSSLGDYIDNIDIAGWKYLRCQIESIHDGAVTVVSNAIY